jgi:hypothetical protein
LRIELQQVSKTARRLLKHLGVDKTAVAYDGPGNVELLETLAWAEDYDESAVITATRRIGRLVEVLEAVEASELPRVDWLTSARHRDGGFSYVAADDVLSLQGRTHISDVRFTDRSGHAQRPHRCR